MLEDKQKIVSRELALNLETVKNMLGNASDILIREFVIVTSVEIKAALIAMKGLSNNELINEQVLLNLMSDIRFKETKNAASLFDKIEKSGMPND